MRWGGAQDGTGRRRVPHRTDTVVATLARDRWRALVGFGYVLTGSVGEAEDLAQEALAGLSPRERACVVLRHLEDLGVAETADLLGISTGAVKRYTSDGIERLEARVGPVRRVGHEIAPVDRGSR